MSPSFSRSASSTTITGRPSAMSLIARTTSSRGMAGSFSSVFCMISSSCVVSTVIGSPETLIILPSLLRCDLAAKAKMIKVFFHVLRDHVDLKVDLGARLLDAERGALERLWDQADLEPVVTDRRDGQADAVDRDGALVHHVPGQAGGEADAPAPPVLVGIAAGDGGGAVGVPLDEVAAEPVGEPDRALQVDPGAWADGLEAGVPEGLPHHVGGKADRHRRRLGRGGAD